MDKDWVGNKNSVFKSLAASSHSDGERETNDYYATDPKALELFLDKIDKDGIKLHKDIWECACGEGNLSEVLKKRGYNVFSSDLIDRGYGITGDFLNFNPTKTMSDGFKSITVPDYIHKDILTNPPYKYALDFVKHALEIQADGYHTIMFLKIQFLEGKERYKFFQENPPKFVYVHSERQKCAINNNFKDIKSSAVCYAWFIWEKGFKGDTIVRWI